MAASSSFSYPDTNTISQPNRYTYTYIYSESDARGAND
jgi:hypothetical protein